MPWSLAAQDGAFLESFAEAPVISRTQLAALLESADLTVIIDGDEAGAVRADELGDIIMQLGPYRDTVGYRLFPGPRYAIRTLREENLYPESARLIPAGSLVDGTTALQLIRPALTHAVRDAPDSSQHVEIPTRTISSRPDGPWLEWDLEQTGSITHRDSGDSSTGVASTSVIDTEVVFGRAARLVTQMAASGTYRDDGTESADLRVPQARLDLFREPPGRGWTGSFSLGRIDDTDVVHDGIAVKLSSASVISSASVGYTGGVAAVLNRIPVADTDSSRDRPLGEGQFSPERIAAHGDILLPEILGRQNPSVAILSLVDPSESDALNQVRLGLSGPLSVSVFYDLSADLQFGSSRGWASRASLRWYPNVSRTTQLELSTAVAGSDRNDNQGYVALGDDSPWSAYPGAFTNIAATTARYTARLAEPWLVSASSTVLHRVDSEGSTETSPAQTVNNAPFLGWDGGAHVGIQPIPDLFFDLNGNIFVPGTEAWNGTYADSAQPMWKTEIQVTVRL